MAPTTTTPAQGAPAQPVPEVRDPDTLYLQADEFINEEENGRYIARGNVEVFAQDRVVRADQVEYYPEEGRLVATGNLTMIGADGSVQFADTADISENLDEAVAVNFSQRMINGALITAAYMERSEGTQNLLTRATYSPCPVCETDPTPTWRLQARKVLQDTEAKMIYYRDVTLNIAGVPVFYSPFFAHADPSVDRKTGPLPPRIGFSTLTGFRYEQPYFWAIDDHQDLTILPRVMSEVRPLLGLNYRRRFWSGYVEFDVTATKEELFNSAGQTFGKDIWRSSILGGGVFAIDQDWAWGFGVERVADTQYLVRYNINHDEFTGLYSGFGNALVSQLYAAGQDEDFYSSVTVADFQSIYLGPSDRLPRLLPLSEYRRTFDLNDFGRLESVADLTFLTREQGVEYLRATGWADWSRRHVTRPGIVIEGLAHARGDVYRIGDAFDPVTGAPKEGSASRASAYGGVDVSWPFYRPGPIGLVVEPRAQFVGSVGKYNALEGFASTFTNGVPTLLREDALTTELNGSNLFAPDKFAGLDLIEEGLRANVGVAFHATADETGSASLFIGQSYRTDPEIFTPSSGLDKRASDYVAEAQVLTENVSLNTRLRIDPEDFELERLETTGSAKIGMFTIEGSYLNFAETVLGATDREYITGAATVRLTENIMARAFIARDLKLKQTQARALQATYFDECFEFTLSYVEEYFPGTATGNSKSIMFSLVLFTLGGVGGSSSALETPMY